MSLLVQLKHPDIGAFTEEFATNLSPGGMFVRSRQPQPVGTTLKFEVKIAGGVRVMKGTAVVRWIREPGDPAGAPGMGVEFLELDEATRSLVEKMLRTRPPEKDLQAPAAPAPHPDALALEAELRARYGELASRAEVLPSMPVVAPVAPAVSPVNPATPAVAPAAPAIAPGAQTNPRKATVAAPAPAPAPASDRPATELLSLFDGEELSATPRPLSFDDFPSSPSRILEFELPPTPSTDVDIPFSELIAGTLPPTPESVSSGSRVAPPVNLELELPPELAPKRAPAASPEEPDPFAFDDWEGAKTRPAAPPEEPAVIPLDESEISRTRPPVPPDDPDPFALSQWEVARSEPPTPRGAPPAAPPPASPSTPAAPSLPPDQLAELEIEFNIETPAPFLFPPPEDPPRASAPPAPAAAPAASSLPSIQRDAARSAPAPQPTPTLLTPAPQQAPPAPPAPRPDGTTPLVFLTPPAKIEGVGPVIGIDLGTTNSCVAILSSGKPIVLRSKDGYNTVPSVISLSPKGQLLVSHRARGQLLLNPANTIHGAKRLVGRPYDSPIVNEVRERFHYEVCPDFTGRAAVRLKQNVLSLEEVQGIILRECREMAEQHLGKKVERAVITVPAYYSEPQREAVRKAGALAGLKVERILNEPTAAALAYGLNRELSKKVLVYDLGGGTFDATVMRIEKNVFEVLATGGDTFLGGVDFDSLLVDFLLQKFQDQERLTFAGDSVALSRVSDAAERAKVALSERTSTEVDIPMLMMDEKGQPRSMRVTMTRDDLNQVCGGLVNRSLDVVRDVLLDAKLKPKDIDDIILVGGQSRMLLVREKLKELFGRPPHASVNADEAVALGAALYSGVVDKVSSVVLVDVLPMTIGVGLAGGVFKRVIERNSPLPAQRSFSLSTARDDEEIVEISIFQGEDPHVAGNEYLGTLRVEGLPRAPKGVAKVAVTIKLDSECVLHVEAREMSTNKEIKATLATRYTPEQLQKQLNYGREAVKAAEAKATQDLRERGGRFWSFLKKVIGKA